MTLLLTMLPFYLLGNIHCLGMCGPLVMTIGRHPHRLWYFLGRTLSFTLAGGIAGALGAVLSYFLQMYHISALVSIVFGAVILWIGVSQFFGFVQAAFRWMAPINQQLTKLALSPHPLALFLFGFFTIALPCGQTVVVYSAIAIAGNLNIGLINGLVFALMTSPSLFFAMHSYNFLKKYNKNFNRTFAFLCLFVGILSICRGLAELEWIPHLELSAGNHLHLVIY